MWPGLIHVGKKYRETHSSFMYGLDGQTKLQEAMDRHAYNNTSNVNYRNGPQQLQPFTVQEVMPETIYVDNLKSRRTPRDWNQTYNFERLQPGFSSPQ